MLIFFPPLNPNSRNVLKKLWYEKVKLIKDLYLTKNAILTSIVKINNKLNYFLKKYSNKSIEYSNIDMNLDIDDQGNVGNEEDEKNKIKISSNWTISFEKNVTLNYNLQLKEPSFIYEEELEHINIVYKNNKIQYCSIDLLLKKLIEDNSLNIQIYVNHENNQTFNFINAFIFQCFGFISYEILINKILALHKYYKYHNLLNNIKNKRLLILIFKITKYLLDHEIYNCSYFQYSDELKNKIKVFLKENNMKDKIKSLLDYKKGKSNKAIKENDLKLTQKKNYALYTVKTFKNTPHSGFEFNILEYKESDIALVISYISIKYLNNLYNYLYELNPTIKKNKIDKLHLLEVCDFSNKLSYFLIEESLSYDYIEVRAKIVEKIIKVLIELRNLNNFNDLLTIYSALVSIFIRIPKTCNLIDPKLKAIFNEIKNFCSANECYKNIRDESSKCLQKNIFYIPYIGITLKHINFYDEGTKYIGHNGLVCIEKIIVTQKEIEDFRNELKPLRQQKVIKLNNNNDINKLKSIFYNLNPKNYDDLVNIGDKLEPEFTLYKEPDRRKRKTSTEIYINSNEYCNN